MIKKIQKKLIIEKQNLAGIELLTGRFEANRKIKFFFTSRPGGFSREYYSSMNLSLKLGDDESMVRKNRQALFRAMDLPLENTFIPQQIHGNCIKILDDPPKNNEVEGCDGLITGRADTPLMALFADCIPVVIFDDRAETIAVLHAGWRGTYSKIINNAIEMIKSRFNIDAKNLHAVIGPGIGQCCYEVGEELVKKFPEFIDMKNGISKLNLKAANKRQLLDKGLTEHNIHDIDVCTSCDQSYFSYRRDSGETGRHAAIACII